MKQLSLLDDPSPKSASDLELTYWKVYVDGAARNNPGPAGAGVCILKNDAVVKKTGAYLGVKTNNQAEYLALLLGLFHIQQCMAADDMLLVISDSQLLVRQLQGSYRVKESHLKPLYALAHSLLERYNYDIAHVLREENSAADEQANSAIDKKIKPPQSFIAMLHEHSLSLD